MLALHRLLVQKADYTPLSTRLGWLNACFFPCNHEYRQKLSESMALANRTLWQLLQRNWDTLCMFASIFTRLGTQTTVPSIILPVQSMTVFLLSPGQDPSISECIVAVILGKHTESAPDGNQSINTETDHSMQVLRNKVHNWEETSSYFLGSVLRSRVLLIEYFSLEPCHHALVLHHHV